jgi:hypothetical protein
VRSPLSQITIVEGGPGTGKTVVALHRAAWLLYTHRDQLARDGVLIVGPSGAFLHYIDQVLPSLGETDVVLLTPGQLYPAVNAKQYDDAAASAIKGSTRMVRVIAAALDSIIRIPTSDVTIDLEDGSSVRITAKQLAEARRQVPKDFAFHLAREPFLEKALQHLCRYRARQRGWDERDADIRADVLADLTGDRHIRRVLNLMWMPSTPERLISRLLEDSQFLAQAANGILSPSEQRILLAARVERPIWTVDDAALLDEAAEVAGQGVVLERVAAQHTDDAVPLFGAELDSLARIASLDVHAASFQGRAVLHSKGMRSRSSARMRLRNSSPFMFGIFQSRQTREKPVGSASSTPSAMCPSSAGTHSAPITDAADATMRRISMESSTARTFIFWGLSMKCRILNTTCNTNSW